MNQNDLAQAMALYQMFNQQSGGGNDELALLLNYQQNQQRNDLAERQFENERLRNEAALQHILAQADYQRALIDSKNNPQLSPEALLALGTQVDQYMAAGQPVGSVARALLERAGLGDVLSDYDRQMLQRRYDAGQLLSPEELAILGKQEDPVGFAPASQPVGAKLGQAVRGFNLIDVLNNVGSSSMNFIADIFRGLGGVDASEPLVPRPPKLEDIFLDAILAGPSPVNANPQQTPNQIQPFQPF